MMIRTWNIVKKVNVVVVSISIALGIFLAGQGASEAAQPIKLKWALWCSPEAASNVQFRDFAKQLKEKTGGRLDVEMYWASSLGKGPEHYDLASKGLADMAYVVLSWTPGRFPMSQVLDMPVASQTSENMAKAIWQVYKKGYFDKEFKDVKVLALWGISASLYGVHTRKAPFLTLEDFKGKKIRGAGSIQNEVTKLLGAEPVGMPATELYIAMDRGIVDGYIGALTIIPEFRLAPVTKHSTMLPIAALSLALVMNKNYYEGLPRDIRKVVDEFASDNKLGISFSSDFSRAQEIGRKQMEESGGQIHVLPAAEMDRIGARLYPIWERWIADGEAKRLPRRQMLTDLYSTLKGLAVEKPYLGFKP